AQLPARGRVPDPQPVALQPQDAAAVRAEQRVGVPALARLFEVDQLLAAVRLAHADAVDARGGEGTYQPPLPVRAEVRGDALPHPEDGGLPGRGGIPDADRPLAPARPHAHAQLSRGAIIAAQMHLTVLDGEHPLAVRAEPGPVD